MPTDLEALRKACDGLLYPSETDQPFEVREWEPADSAREALLPSCDKLEEVPYDKFFDDFQENDPTDQRIPALKTFLATHLDDLHVFRSGMVEVRIFIMGRNRAGRWIGLQTISVET